MGVYDTVIILCPNCGEPYYAQSKGSDDCRLREFTLENAPTDVMSNVNRHAPFVCECGCIFEVVLRVEAKTRILGKKEKDD